MNIEEFKKAYIDCDIIICGDYLCVPKHDAYFIIYGEESNILCIIRFFIIENGQIYKIKYSVFNETKFESYQCFLFWETIKDNYFYFTYLKGCKIIFYDNLDEAYKKYKAIKLLR